MVQQKIKNIVEESLPELKYLFNDWSRINVQLDFKGNLPAFVSVLPVSGQLFLKNANFRDYPNCMFAFLDLAELDLDGEENEVTIERMKKHAKKFIQAVNASGKFAPISENIPYQAIYDFLDVNVTGISIQIQLKELVGDCAI